MQPWEALPPLAAVCSSSYPGRGRPRAGRDISGQVTLGYGRMYAMGTSKEYRLVAERGNGTGSARIERWAGGIRPSTPVHGSSHIRRASSDACMKSSVEETVHES